MYMKKVTTLLAALVLAGSALVGSAATTAVGGVEVTDLRTSVLVDSDDTTLSVSGTSPISLFGHDLAAEVGLGFSSDDIVSDFNLLYDLRSFGATTVYGIGGLGLNYVDKADLEVDVRGGIGVSHALRGGKSVFVDWTWGHNFTADENDTQVRVGLSLKF